MATTLPLAAGRVPPHDLDAEMSIIGSILLDPLSIAKVLQFLHPEDFYRENNGQIYRAALDLFAAGEPIDNVTLAAQLQQMGLLDRVGGRAQLASMQSAVPTAANIEYYGRIVKERAYKRRLISAGGNIAGFGFDDSIEAEDAINQAQSLVFGVADDRDQRELARLYDLLGPAMERISMQMESGQGVVGIPSGFHDLDRMTSGFKDSDLIIVADLQLMHGRARGDDNRVQEVSAISRALKGLARELRIPVIAISQLSRAPEQRPDKRPILSDLRESGCVAGDTPVYLPDSGTYVPIKELAGKSGFNVLALDKGWWRMDSRKVTNVFATATKPVFKLTTH